jgi:hypothetical protein
MLTVRAAVVYIGTVKSTGSPTNIHTLPYFSLPAQNESQLDQIHNMKVTQLKAFCKDCGLSSAGKKSELQERLRHYLAQGNQKPDTKNVDDLDSMTEEDLRHALISNGIQPTGSKAELIERYREDQAYLTVLNSVQPTSDRDSCIIVCNQMELAAKKNGGVLLEYLNEVKANMNKIPKYIDVTVQSLGLKPDVYTAGGAPSVTANVLAQLAGKPFADPPIYGSVSFLGNMRELSCTIFVYFAADKCAFHQFLIVRLSISLVKKAVKPYSAFVPSDLSTL